MKITPIFITAAECSQIAWEYSRPKERGLSNIKEIISLDLPVNEFSTLHLEIESTILEREIFTTMRNHVMWAQTSRVQDVLRFKISNHFDPKEFGDIRKKMKDMAEDNLRQDEFRLHLPIVSMTKYSIQISARNLVKIKKYFDYLAEKLSSRLFCLFYDSAREIQQILNTIGYTEELTKKYKMPKILNERPIKISEALTIDNYVLVSAELPLYLRAQLVRHRSIIFRDNLFGELLSPDFKSKTISMKIKCEFVCSKEDSEEIIAKRNCWIAQYSIWAPMLDLLGSKNSKFLPCSEGRTCPFSKDAMLRYEGADPNPPCPIHLGFEGISPSQKQRDAMTKMVINDKRPEFWHKEIKELK